jgi:hypothetical protein
MAVQFKENKLQKTTWSADCERGYFWNQKKKKKKRKHPVHAVEGTEGE